MAKFAPIPTIQLVLWVRFDCRFVEAVGPLIIDFVFYADVVTIDKTGEHFRLIYDVKGRFTIHRISAEEAKVKYFIL